MEIRNMICSLKQQARIGLLLIGILIIWTQPAQGEVRLPKLVSKGMVLQRDAEVNIWAWGASRVLNYLKHDTTINAQKVCIEGVSWYGKAALVAMVYDPRFAIALIGSSGEFHWFAGTFLKYAGPLDAGDLKEDTHELIASF